MRIETDGTIAGTKVFDDDEEAVSGVVSVQRVGRDVYVTRRYKDVAITLPDGTAVNGDYALTVPKAIRSGVISGS